MENCQLCSKEYNPNAIHYSSNLETICHKYLPSSFTQNVQNQAEQQGSSLCPKCVNSAMELYSLSEKINAFQKRMSESIFSFSLEILHRKGKIGDIKTMFKDTNPETELYKRETCAPENFDWDVSKSIYDTQPSSIKIFNDSEDNFEEELDYMPSSSSLTSENLSNGEDINILTKESQTIVPDPLHIDIPYLKFEGNAEEAEISPLAEVSYDTSLILPNIITKSTSEMNTKVSVQAGRSFRGQRSRRRFSTKSKPIAVTQDKSFMCSICNNSFSTKFAMTRHSRIHTGEKPFTCDICDFATSRKNILESHKIYRHSNRKDFQCRKCKRKFKTLDSIKIHIKRTHLIFDVAFSNDCIVKV